LAVRKVLLDKTGTLTLGQLALAPVSAPVLAALAPRERAVLRHMVERSNHPVSTCLAGALRELGGTGDGEPITGAAAEDLVETPGSGLALTLPDGVWRLGRPAFARPDAAAHGRGDATLFTCDGRPVAAFTLREDFKADAAGEVAALRAEGYDVWLLSGDAQDKVDRAAQALDLPRDRALGGLSPEAKASRVRAVDVRDTLMVGDGLNDSPSFEAALCAATPAVDRPVLPGKADFYFLGDGIAAIHRSLRAAHALRRVVRDNLAIAVVYNVAAVGLCLAGQVTPVVAAIIMPVSSVFVVSLTALRLSGRRQPWTSSSPWSSSA
jgi:Cu2+-exporting ATPase